MDTVTIIMGLIWILPGLMAAKRALAWEERRVLERYPDQNTMDGDDWVGAISVAAAAFVVWPIILAVAILRYPATLAWKPTRAYLVPPVQKAWEGHVQAMDNQKALIMSTAKTYQEVLAWDPKDEVRDKMLQTLKSQLEDQMTFLMQMCDSTNGHDGDYLQAVKFDVQKELTA